MATSGEGHVDEESQKKKGGRGSSERTSERKRTRLNLSDEQSR
jgi:hypothetical protein